MEKFKVGQRVTINNLESDDRNDFLGIPFGSEVVVVSDASPYNGYNGIPQTRVRHKSGIERTCYTERLRHIPPKPVLTEWQEKKVGECLNRYGHEFFYHEVNFMDDLKSILSEPDPPKFEPKQGDAVLVREDNIVPWIPRVATGNGFVTYNVHNPNGNTWNYCIPFDPSLVGKV